MIKSTLAIIGLVTMLVMAEAQYSKFMDSDVADKFKDAIERIEDKLDE